MNLKINLWEQDKYYTKEKEGINNIYISNNGYLVYVFLDWNKQAFKEFLTMRNTLYKSNYRRL